MTAEEAGRVLGDLECLLEKQIALVRRGDFEGVEQAANQADLLVSQIADDELLREPAVAERRCRIEKLYKQLTVMLGAERSGIARAVGRIQKGRKTLSAYRSSS